MAIKVDLKKVPTLKLVEEIMSRSAEHTRTSRLYGAVEYDDVGLHYTGVTDKIYYEFCIPNIVINSMKDFCNRNSFQLYLNRKK